MNKDRDFVIYLQDMLESTVKGISFIENMSYQDFSSDEKTQYAIIRAIEVIGEASTKIPKEIKSKFSQIPWREVSRMHNKLIHDYFGVNLEVVWKTGQEDLPTLKLQLEQILSAL